MNLKNRMIMEEYHEVRPLFVKLGDIVDEKLRGAAKQLGVEVMAIEHRVKAEESLAGKLELKGDKYSSLADITDILGARIICFFCDEVDKFAEVIEEMFVIDRENSVDKRKQLSPNSFGYLSLHYICSLPFNAGYPEELCGKKFEIQIRSVLQHTWAAIYHDLGYKNDFGIPKALVRAFSRMAGLLELADEQFAVIRDSANKYSDDIRQKIISGNADDVLIDSVSIREYVARNNDMRAFLQEIADLCGAEISEIDPQSYIEQLLWLKKNTIGDLQKMLEADRGLALRLAERSLKGTDLDILSSNVGLRFLCRAELVSGGYTREQAAEFLAISFGDKKRAERQAKYLFDSFEKAEVTSK